MADGKGGSAKAVAKPPSRYITILYFIAVVHSEVNETTRKMRVTMSMSNTMTNKAESANRSLSSGTNPPSLLERKVSGGNNPGLVGIEVLNLLNKLKCIRKIPHYGSKILFPPNSSNYVADLSLYCFPAFSHPLQATAGVNGPLNSHKETQETRES